MSAALTMPAEISATQSDGSSAGSLRIGNDGNAYYGMPLSVVPGRNGMAPSLALQYVSNDAIGQLGRGWTLEGVPAITRCARTIATDGYARTVRYDEDDAYCLAGERLIKVSDNTAYADFRTESESFRLIRMYREGGTTSHWRVRLTNGGVQWYGLEEQGARRPLSAEATIHSWMIAKEEDAFGNSMQYLWSEPEWPVDSGPRGQIGQVVLERIDYAAHETGLAADRSVRFEYGRHAVARDGFDNQLAWRTDHRLERVAMSLRDDEVRAYYLDYEDEGASRVSRLVQVTHCVAAPPEPGAEARDHLVCMNPTRFEWSFAAEETEPYNFTGVFNTDYTVRVQVANDGIARHYDGTSVLLDANGDGATDLAYVEPLEHFLHLHLTNRASDHPFRDGTEVRTSIGGFEEAFSAAKRFFVVDWNNDGKDDLLRMAPVRDTDGTPVQYDVRVLVSTGTDFVDQPTGLSIPAANAHAPFTPGGTYSTHVAIVGEDYGYMTAPLDPQYDQSVARVGDFNRDGYVDFLTCEVPDGVECVQYRTDGSSRPLCILDPVDSTARNGQWFVSWGGANVEGGRTFGPREATGVTYPCGVALDPAFGLASAADVNGDGALDVLLPSDLVSGPYQILQYQQESSGFTLQELDLHVENALFPQFVDINGDGNMDIVARRRVGDIPDVEHDTTHAYSEGIRSEWVMEIHLGQGNGTFILSEMGFPEGWADENVHLGYRRGACEDAEACFPTCDCDRYAYSHNPFPVLGSDTTGDGRQDLGVFSVSIEREIFSKVSRWEGADIWGTGEQNLTLFDMSAGTLSGNNHFEHGPTIHTSQWAKFSHSTPWQILFDDVVRQGDFDGDGFLDVVTLGRPRYFPTHGFITPFYGSGEGATYLNERAQHERIVAFVDGIGTAEQVAYGPTSDPELYTHGEGCEWPQRCDPSVRWVVQRVNYRTRPGVASRSVRYEYADSRTDRLGRGWLGFSRQTEWDEASGAVTVHHMDNATRDEVTGTYPYAGRVTRRLMLIQDDGSQWDYPDDSLTLSAVVDDTRFGVQHYGQRVRVIELGRSQYRYTEEGGPHAVEARDYEAMAAYAPIGENHTSESYDSSLPFGQRHYATNVKSIHANGESTTIHREMVPPESGEDDASGDWMVGRIASYRRSTSDECGRADSFRAFYDDDGRLQRVVRRPDEFAPGRSAEERVAEMSEVEVTYDVYGHTVHTEVRDTDGNKRVSVLKYNAIDAFTYPSDSYNALGHRTRLFWREFDGLQRGVVDANEVASWNVYDGFGRLREAHSPTTPVTYYTYEDIGDGQVEARTEQDGAGYAVAVYDHRGLAVTSRWLARAPDGSLKEVSAHREYDVQGRLQRESAPSFDLPELWATNEYDGMGLLRRVTDVRGEVSHSWYRPTRIYHRDAIGRTAWESINAMGQVASAQGFGEDNAMVFERCIDGSPVRTHDPAGNTTSVQYDPLGRPIFVDEPDAGIEKYQYNAFGELVWSHDAEERVATFAYDDLGRLVRRFTSAGELVLEYDAPGALGMLRFAKSEDDIEQWFDRDEFGRVERASQTVDGVEYAFEYEFDALGRPLHTTYPSLEGTPFRVDYEYDGAGNLSKVNSSRGNLWEAIGDDALGHLVAERFGNGFETHRSFVAGTNLIESLNTSGFVAGEGVQSVQDWGFKYDEIGRVVQQWDDAHGFEEEFSYWPSGQLHQASASECDDGDPCTLTFNYDALGNMTWASDTGTMHYDGPQPHAVSEFQGLLQHYDRTGRHLGDKARRWVEYDGRGLPVKIEDLQSGDTVQLRYGPAGVRAASDGPEGFRVYFQNYERRDNREVYRVPVGSGVAEVNRKIGKNDFQIAYAHRGRGQSIEAVIGDDRKIISISNYTPFGNRRHLSWTQNDDRGFVAVDHGFGGHEEEDAGGLINMGGRQYDPKMRQMTSPDPYVVAPLSVVGYNRYAYAFGDPVNYWDPNGLQVAALEEAEERTTRAGEEAPNSTLVPVGTGETFPLPPVVVPGRVDPPESAGASGQTARSEQDAADEAAQQATPATNGEATNGEESGVDESLVTRARENFQNSEMTQAVAGLGTGLLVGVAPGGFTAPLIVEGTGASAALPRTYRLWAGAGEMFWGLAQMLVGGAGALAGGGMVVGGAGVTATGVGAAPGLGTVAAGGALATASAGVAVEGAADVVSGFGIFMAAMMGDDPPSGTGGGRASVDETSPPADLSTSQRRAIRSYRREIARHQEKIRRFRENPTVRPGMEGLPEELIRAQQARRIQHLETEIRTFENNIQKILRGEN